jgi:CRISPR type III-A-associated RAMP protein Csm5
MAQIKIETLTPVHIGSGNLLYNNSDFIDLSINKEPYIAVLSADKIWKLMGEKGVDFIDLWLQTIEKKGNIREFIAKFAPDAKSKDYAKRRMPLFVVKALKEDDTLKECIHNGMGLPYIPGSSIKGAIRTAVLASLANNVQDADDKIIVKQRNRDGDFVHRKDKYGNILVEAKKVEQQLFGKDPNSDVFRFIQVGDAYFEKETEIVTRMINLNIRQSDDLMDSSKPQLVEAIGQESESEFQIKVATEYYDFVRPKYSELEQLPIRNINDLFSLINANTRKLVEEEIEEWRNIEKSGAENYVGEMDNVLKSIDSCKNGKSCILRIGHASGWRFITGAWAESLNNFKDIVVPASRPKNFNYNQYVFPKSRRLDEESYVFGFVKLTLNE